jgi:parvulin-like peptidyl-prolyl isomerase
MPIKKNTKELSRNNPLRSVQEKKQNRLILIGFIITAVLIVGFSGYALVYEFLIKNRIPVAQVNSVKIDNKYYQERVRLERYSYIQQYQSLVAQYQFFAQDESTAQFFQSQLMQMSQILDNYEFFGETVLDTVINDELVAQQAEAMGVEVSDDEVEQSIQEIFAYFPDGTPTPQPIATVAPTATLSATQEAILGSGAIQESISSEPDEEAPVSEESEGISTEDASESATGESAPPEEEEIQEQESTETTTGDAETSAEETPVPTATPYTEELFKENFQGYLNDIKLVGISEDGLRKYIHSFLLNQKVRAEIVKDVSEIVEQVWARHILVGSLAEAEIVLTRLDGGEDWAAIAAEVSLDTSNKDQGGDLGWFPRGRMVTAFEEAAFKMEIGAISEPVETQFGWHVIQVIGHDTLSLSAGDYQNEQEAVYREWLNDIRENSDIVINDVWKEIVPSQPVIPF